MLFRADIKSIIPLIIYDKDAPDEEKEIKENLLAEKLYVFLNDYVPKRLMYESDDEREDCVQETMMYLLKRFRKINRYHLETINMEKFFYNRANSFIAGYIRKLKIEKNARKKYIDHQKYLNSIKKDMREYEEYINESLLNRIIEMYELNKQNKLELKKIVLQMLKFLGYDVYLEHEVNTEDNQTFKTLSYAIIDEYMTKSLEESDTYEKHDTGL
jgi:hypothetical protein